MKKKEKLDGGNSVEEGGGNEFIHRNKEVTWAILIIFSL